VVDAAEGIALDVRAVAAQLAEAAQARAERAVRCLLRRELVAVVAAAAASGAGRVGPLQAAAVLRDRLAALPVAKQAPGRKPYRRELLGLELLRDLFGRRAVVEVA